jgi:hypothetical protein
MAGNGDFQFDMVASHVMALVHSTQGPSDDVWEQHYRMMYDAVGEDRFIELGYLVITAGGAPNARQRRVGNQAVRGRKMARAIVTDSFVVRQLVKSWSWFAPGLRAFAPDEIEPALLSVGLKPDEVESVWTKVVELNRGLSAPVSWVAPSRH